MVKETFAGPKGVSLFPRLSQIFSFIHRYPLKTGTEVGRSFATGAAERRVGSSTMQELDQTQLVKNHFDNVSDVWGDLYTRDVTFANYNFVIPQTSCPRPL